ncbi:hypothetical protein XENOCAPTIV_023129, partial [Xenoophorus captivus]
MSRFPGIVMVLLDLTAADGVRTWRRQTESALILYFPLLPFFLAEQERLPDQALGELEKNSDKLQQRTSSSDSSQPAHLHQLLCSLQKQLLAYCHINAVTENSSSVALLHKHLQLLLPHSTDIFSRSAALIKESSWNGSIREKLQGEVELIFPLRIFCMNSHVCSVQMLLIDYLIFRCDLRVGSRQHVVSDNQLAAPAPGDG